ncbi:hypothetical protein [Cutibacterium modestum]|uniref:hypothetical protein n=1 Tax=Cutibacterium modestum TaxID=2559073 RepID=UPI001D0C5579|nr:hypothetical protein [Cutibacterium modestum]
MNCSRSRRALAVVLVALSVLAGTAINASATLTEAKWKALLASTAATLIYVLVGFALGLAFLNAPAAIVVTLVVPTTVLPPTALVKQLHPNHPVDQLPASRGATDRREYSRRRMGSSSYQHRAVRRPTDHHWAVASARARAVNQIHPRCPVILTEYSRSK